MENIFLYGVSLVAITISSIVTYFLYRKNSKQFVQAFLDSQNNIVVLIKGHKVSIINKFGLNVFGYSSMNDFTKSKLKLTDFFMEEDELLSKYTFGEKWLEKLLSVNSVTIKNLEQKIPTKVKIFSKKDEMERYYHVKVSHLPGRDEYMVSFTDITQLEKDRSSLKKSAEYDQLTKIYNRVKLNSMMSDILFNFNKYDHKFSIILFDIDHFKMVNDTYGHNIGDVVLVTLAQVVKNKLRANDTFVRWGGEEFVILYESDSLDEAVKLASRVRVAVESHVFEKVNKVTCSFGVTQILPGDTKEVLFERVDEALYEAKDNGRNRVVVKR